MGVPAVADASGIVSPVFPFADVRVSEREEEIKKKIY